MSPLAVGPILALLGVVAAFYVLRGRAKTRKSMYRTLRERREGELRKARERATAAKRAAEKSEIEKETKEQAAARRAAAASTAAPAEPSASAPIPQVPAYTPPPPKEKEPEVPSYTPPSPPPAAEEAPAYEPPPPPPPAPEPTLPVREAGKSTWEIVEPAPKADAMSGGGAPSAGSAHGVASGKAAWELDPAAQRKVDEALKERSRGGGDEEEQLEGESLAQTLLSYAGLVAALLVILLGILFMIGSKATG